MGSDGAWMEGLMGRPVSRDWMVEGVPRQSMCGQCGTDHVESPRGFRKNELHILTDFMCRVTMRIKLSHTSWVVMVDVEGLIGRPALIVRLEVGES